MYLKRGFIHQNGYGLTIDRQDVGLLQRGCRHNISKGLCALFVDINSQTRFFIGIKIPTIKNCVREKRCSDELKWFSLLQTVVAISDAWLRPG